MATSIKLNKYIVHASVIISHLMVDETVKPEHEVIIIAHLKHKTNLCASTILPFEIGNALKSAVLSKRLNSNQALALYKEFSNLAITLLPLNYRKSLELSINNNLSFYDASYLALAKQLKAPLLTLDKKLLALTKI